MLFPGNSKRYDRIVTLLEKPRFFMTNEKDSDKFTRPLGLSNDGKTMTVFSSLEEAQEHIKKHSTVIVVDKDGNKVVRPAPWLDKA